ncbi:TetR/AcrR family transcriptional regulator [Streptomyces sp. TLI_171]|uniref:TetR/AcrR family transcriptional regulator n=1 Tax=Streptomyces sp. TLI_171 TaxID=1938859 RepID=UPI000C17CBB7|nr:TetR/AcrR family transcriptional regulator [Streptomyces sp. TLI_171]RKE21541.1 TetR family transcriptional regulator [Streptomyces sp. TLI_171]
MSPRKSVAEAAATRARILDRTLALAVAHGLEGVTIGVLADDLGMSKAGVIGPFGTKEELHLAVVDEAVTRFRATVLAPLAGARPGPDRLIRAHDAWFAYMTADGHTGCFLTAVAAEFDARPGAVRDRVREALDRWDAFVLGELEAGLAAGGLSPGADLDQLLFELRGIALAADQSIQLRHDPHAADRAGRAVRRLLATA